MKPRFEPIEQSREIGNQNEKWQCASVDAWLFSWRTTKVLLRTTKVLLR